MRAEGEKGGEKGAQKPKGGGTEGSTTMPSRAEIGGRDNTLTSVGCPCGEHVKKSYQLHEAQRRGASEHARSQPPCAV